jgi:hypothetical protein
MTAAQNEMTEDCRAAFEKWLNGTVDVRYEYDPVCGYTPQEVYQLYQSWRAAWNTRPSEDKAVSAEILAELLDICNSENMSAIHALDCVREVLEKCIVPSKEGE